MDSSMRLPRSAELIIPLKWFSYQLSDSLHLPPRLYCTPSLLQLSVINIPHHPIPLIMKRLPQLLQAPGIHLSLLPYYARSRSSRPPQSSRLHYRHGSPRFVASIRAGEETELVEWRGGPRWRTQMLLEIHDLRILGTLLRKDGIVGYIRNVGASVCGNITIGSHAATCVETG